MDDIRKDWEFFIEGFANWKSFITLTFDEADRSHKVTRTEAEFKFRRLVQALNVDLFGKNYVKIVGHSYFSYVVAYEPTKQGLLHIHVLIDKPVNYSLVISNWYHHSGYVVIEPVKDKGKVCRYVCKYITKNGDLDVFKTKKEKKPSFSPMWYLDAIGQQRKTA